MKADVDETGRNYSFFRGLYRQQARFNGNVAAPLFNNKLLDISSPFLNHGFKFNDNCSLV